jgi:DNA-directed RNA polymerase specialized sigma subunit
MKYQVGLEKVKKHLQSIPEPEIREECERAGLTEKETSIIVLKFRKHKPRLQASDDLGMSESRYSVRLTSILNILKKFLIAIGALDE